MVKVASELIRALAMELIPSMAASMVSFFVSFALSFFPYWQSVDGKENIVWSDFEVAFVLRWVLYWIGHVIISETMSTVIDLALQSNVSLSLSFSLHLILFVWVFFFALVPLLLVCVFLNGRRKSMRVADEIMSNSLNRFVNSDVCLLRDRAAPWDVSPVESVAIEEEKERGGIGGDYRDWKRGEDGDLIWFPLIF